MLKDMRAFGLRATKSGGRAGPSGGGHANQIEARGGLAETAGQIARGLSNA
jgi:hypothetical protein